MSEAEWWATAPEWAKWHTWDDIGRCWWEKKPTCVDGRWFFQASRDELTSEQYWYDQTPCPVEIDPTKTLRKRPKEQP
jgi:hypothetical protein